MNETDDVNGAGDGERALEAGITTDVTERMDDGGYLDLATLLSAQHPVSRPEHPDELLFIIQHQTTELWFKLVLHELRGVRVDLDVDDVARARKALARVKHIFRVLSDQWSVLATLTPSEYAEFRGDLGSSSGFQSWQYRSVEFILGNKNRRMLAVFDAQPETRADLEEILETPTVYDAFQFWRFRHLRTVQRTIGFKTGTGGSSGVDFLRRALDLTFFPELYSVRTDIGT